LLGSNFFNILILKLSNLAHINSPQSVGHVSEGVVETQIMTMFEEEHYSSAHCQCTPFD